MEKVGFIRVHFVAIFFALVVGFVYLLPQLLFMIEAGKDYHYPFLAMPDDRHYASRIREVYDGHYAIANPDLKEYKHAASFWQPLSELIVGGTGRLLGIKFETLFVLSDFLFPLIVYLLIYAFAFLVTGSRGISVLASGAIMTVSIVIFGPPQALIYWIDRLELFSVPPILNPKSSFLFSRKINPQFNSIFFFLTLISVYRTVFRKGAEFVILGGVVLGSMFYVNFYYWSYVFGGCGIFCLYCLWKKEYGTFSKLAALVLVASLLSIPYWIGVYKLSGDASYDDVVRRAYMAFSNKPYLPKLELIVCLVFLGLCSNKDRTYFFLGSFLVGGILCENQQIVSGRKMHPYHWSIYCQAPVAWIGFALMASRAEERWSGSHWFRAIKKRRKSIVPIVFLLMILNAVHTQIVYVYAADRGKGPRAFYEKSLQQWLEYEKLESALRWLNEQGEKDSVVLASMWSSYVITNFTHCNIVAGWSTHVYLISDEELWERWLLKYYFFGVPEDRIYETIEPNLDGLCELCPWLRDEEKRPAFRVWLEAQYREMREQPLEALLAKYSVEYVLYSEEEREEYKTAETRFSISKYPFLARIIENEEVELYKVIETNTSK